jgi:hypothetical protein
LKALFNLSMLVNFQSNRTIGSISIGLFPVRIIKRKKIPTGPRPQTSVATGFFFWVAIDHGSQPDFFFGSRPVVGRDPPENSGCDLDRVEVPNTNHDHGTVTFTLQKRKNYFTLLVEKVASRCLDYIFLIILVFFGMFFFLNKAPIF